jgi:hypothetical protein
MPYAKLNSRPPLYPEGYREVTTVPVHHEVPSWLEDRLRARLPKGEEPLAGWILDAIWMYSGSGPYSDWISYPRRS